MTKTLAERQADYRKRRPTAGNNGERRINTWINTAAYLALNRLATRNGITKRAMLENLIQEADRKLLSILDPDSKEWDEYFNVTA
jgi:hypothetical protein